MISRFHRAVSDSHRQAKIGRSGDVRCMAGLPLKAEVWLRISYVAQVPQADQCGYGATSRDRVDAHSITSSAHSIAGLKEHQ
jgi:hypothetical protein